jgi:thiol:disulfide interchange protein
MPLDSIGAIGQQATNSMHAIETLSMLFGLINALIHVLFAGAVARDAGQIQKVGQRPALVSSITWAFATLLGGVMVAAVYWFIHHSTFTRPTNTAKNT